MITSLTADQLKPRLDLMTVIDVRSPGEFAAGRIPGAHNIPADHLDRAVPLLRAVADGGGIAMVCASGARSEAACRKLAGHGIPSATLDGGTSAWTGNGHPVHRPAGARAVWAMDRQVRLVAGGLVILGLLLGILLPGARWLSAAVGAGLLLSAVTNTCAMGTMLGRLPYNRPRAGTPTVDDVIATLRRRAGADA